MRSILLATLVTTFFLGGCAPRPTYEKVKENFWTHLTSPSGKHLLPAEMISWAVDEASCGERVESIKQGMTTASGFWAAHAGIVVRPALGDEPINFVVYCAPFGTDKPWLKKGFALREMTIDANDVITKMSVEVPSDWEIINDRLSVPYNPAAYSTYGAAYNVIGLGLGVMSVQEDGRSRLEPEIGGYFEVRRCIKNCDS